MKKTDIAMIILIASISVLVSYFGAKMVFGDPKQKEATVKVADELSAEVDTPSADIFNDRAVNPTVQVMIGGQNSTVTTDDQIQAISKPEEQ